MSRGRATLEPTPPLTWKRGLKILGPGLITGASDDDPAGIAVYAQAGATYRYSMLWTVFLCLPLMIAVQEICDRTALATGHGLGDLIRQAFGPVGRAVALVLTLGLLVANAINIAADLLAIGSGASMVHLGSSVIWTLVSGVIIMIAVAAGTFTTISKVLRYLCLTLLAYVGVLCIVSVDWGEVLRGSLGASLGGGSAYWQLIVAVLGTTLSPYLLFWQSSNRAEQIKAAEKKGQAARVQDEPTHAGRRRLIIQDRLDVVVGMVFSEIVMFAIITATGATIGDKGASIQTADQAAQAFRPLAGQATALLFAAGFIGSGLLAIPVLAGSAASAIAGLTDHGWGFSKDPRRAPVFYALVGVGTLGGTVLAAVWDNPIRLLILSGLINGIAAAPFMIMVLLVARNRRVMNGHRIGIGWTALGWIAVVAMGIAGAVGIATA